MIEVEDMKDDKEPVRLAPLLLIKSSYSILLENNCN
jgi:hypothetical protein